MEYLVNMNKKKKYSNLYLKEIPAYLCIFFLISKYYIDIILKGMNSPIPKLFLLASLVCAVFLFIVKVINKQISKIEIFLGSVLMIQFLITGNIAYLTGYIFSLSLGLIDFNKIMKCYFFINISYFLAMIILADKNIIEISYIGVRSDLGFKNPNTAFISFFMVWSSFLYLTLKSKEVKNNKSQFKLFRGIDSLILAIMPLAVYFETKTRTGLLTIVLIAIFILLIKLMKNRNISLKILEYIPQLFSVVSIMLALVFGNNWRLNRLLSDRPKYWDMYLTHWKSGLNLFGYDNNIRDYVFADRIPLDSGYIYMLYTGGIILFIILITVMSLSIRQIIKENKIAELVFIMSILIYSFAESILFDISTNPSLILIFTYFFKYWNDMKEVNKIK